MNEFYEMNWGLPSPNMSPDMNAINGVSSNDLAFMRGMGPTTSGEGGIFSNMLGENGWGGLALGGASSLMKGWLGMQQLDMAKKRLSENKRQFDMNWGAQKKLTNSRLEDRQRARVAANPGAYRSVGEYMDQNGIK